MGRQHGNILPWRRVNAPRGAKGNALLFGKNASWAKINNPLVSIRR